MLDHSPFWLVKSHGHPMKTLRNPMKNPHLPGAEAQRCHQGHPEDGAELCDPSLHTLQLGYEWDMNGKNNCVIIVGQYYTILGYYWIIM